MSRLVARYGDGERGDIVRGVDQVARTWHPDDGDLVEFCLAQYAPAGEERDALFARLESVMEQIDGHGLEIGRAARWGSDVDTGGPALPVDEPLAAYDPTAHVTEDLFASKVAFAALLNFPLTTLAERLRDGATYDRRTWAEVRLTHRVDTRIPGNLAAAAS
ncbi:MAG: hypothetical protein ACRDLR_08915, partial [Gaiellaceae bacterium]